MPLFFGPTERPLYGVYHPAAGAGMTGRGIVLCNPYGQEALRAHRPYRVLADAMSRERWHVMRFDYFGTGDSSGDERTASIQIWKENISEAVDELKAMAGIRSVYLLGLRFGATLAAAVAAERDDIRGIVLWEPICDGSEYVNSLVPAGLISGQTVAGEVDGFVLMADLARDIGRLRIWSFIEQLPEHVLIVQSNDETSQAMLHKRLTQSGRQFEYRQIPDPPAWTEENDFGAGPVPARIVSSLASWHPTLEVEK